MKKIYGTYFACSAGNETVRYGGYDLTKESGRPFYCSQKVYGVRPQNTYTGATGRVDDELDLVLYNLGGTEVLIGVAEFRMCAYLYYKFDADEERLIRSNEITKEEYFKRNPIK